MYSILTQGDKKMPFNASYKIARIIATTGILLLAGTLFAAETNVQDRQGVAETMLAIVITDRSIIKEPGKVRLTPQEVALEIPAVSFDMPKLNIQLDLDLEMELAN